MTIQSEQIAHPDLVGGSNTGLHKHEVIAGGKVAGMCFAICGSSKATIGDGELAFTVPSEMNGMVLSNVIASIYSAGSSGTVDIQVRRQRGGTNVDMLLTPVTISISEYFAEDGVVDVNNDDIQTGDQIYVDVDAVHGGAGAKGLSVSLTFGVPA